MATKTARLAGLTGMHTAGIYSDMTVDGPEIGTLVVVVDRAKNLPNRKTMGKQDPYCAARLGKEAKKTETDKRGGQTPKWDQELRFTVHDSPDYHNLKVSVFNDDKKTELIGETWVSLEAVVVPGGGQSDIWHSLNCKGKYAGEIRIELTYYDTRPKSENPAAERWGEGEPVDDLSGQSPSPAALRESTSVKRRPLPSGPMSASSSPAIVPVHALPVPTPVPAPRGYNTPPRPQPQPPVRSDVHTPSSQRRTYTNDHQPQPVQRHSSLPPEDGSPYPQIPPSGRMRPHFQPSQPADSSHYWQSSPADQYSPHPPLQDPNGYNRPRSRDQPDTYTRKPYAVQPIEPLPAQPNAGHRHRASVALGTEYRNPPRDQYVPNNRPHSHNELPHSHSAPVIPSFQTLEPARPERRSHHHPPLASRPYPDPPIDTGPHQAPPSHYGTPHPDEAGYPMEVQGIDEMESFDPSGYPSQSYGYHERSPAQNGHTAGYMQPTVEDEDDVPPPPPPVHRSSAPAAVPLASRAIRHPQNMAPAPLNVATDRHRRSTHSTSTPSHYQQDEYAHSPLSYGARYMQHRHSVSPGGGYDEPLRPISSHSNMAEPVEENAYGLPASLVPGYDATAIDPYHRNSRQHSRRSTGNGYPVSPAGSYHNAPPPAYDTPPQAYAPSQQQPPLDYETPPRPQPYDHHPSTSPHPHTPAEIAPLIKPRAISPDLRHSRGPDRSTPTRKSVSPRPSPSGPDASERRLSGAPFSPDSFDAYNPNLKPAHSHHSPHAARPHSPASPGADPHRPVTGGGDSTAGSSQILSPFHGKPIDPSDHLPVDSWAPEPEPKGKDKHKPIRERVGLTGAREPVPSGQRQRDRDAAIRNAVHAAAGISANAGIPATSPGLPESGGRNRLQKRSPRGAGSVAGGPLVERENVGGFGVGDGGVGMGYVGKGAPPPPVPAKVPLDEGMGMGGAEMSALSRELSGIDIGAPSGARRGGGAVRRWR